MANDITILGGIMLFFIVVGAIVPLVNATFESDDQPRQDIYNFTGNVSEVAKDLSDNSIDPTWLNPTGSLNALTVLTSILSMFFWTFGAIPFWLDLVIFLPLRLIFVSIIARNIWIGGGG